MTKPYAHYGWRCSPYSGKTRAYLAYKRVVYKDVAPTLWHFQRVMKRRVGRVVMPVVTTPDGETLQDTTAIIDALEGRHPTPRVYPEDPALALAALLLELYADEWMSIIAMHTRWNLGPENRAHTVDVFGEGVLPWAPRFIQRAAGRKIAGAMSRYLPILGINEATTSAIDAWCDETLAALDRHLARHLFVLGQRPSIADFALYGPIYAHVWHDPVSRPRVEAHPHLMAWLDRLTRGASADGPFGVEDWDDLRPLFGRLFDEMWPALRTSADALERWAADHGPGDRVPRALGDLQCTVAGVSTTRKLMTYPLWMAQRPVAFYQASADRDALDAFVREVGGDPMTWTPTTALKRPRFDVLLAGEDERQDCLPDILRG